MTGVAAAWRRGQEGWPRRFVLVQFPNVPLLVALAASLVHRLADDDLAGHAEGVSHLGMGIWAYLELFEGVNPFRRLLGAVFLALQVRALGQALG